MTETGPEKSPRSGAPVTASWLTPLRFAGVLILLLAATFPKLLLGEVLFYRDYGFLGYPFVYYHHDSFWKGELPAWNPLSNCGAPFLAQWGTQIFYPFSLIYLLLPLPWSLGFFCLVHLFIGGMGMYYLLDRWTRCPWAGAIGAVLFVFNGATLSSIIYPNYAATISWMPWMVLLVPRACRDGGMALLGAIVVSTCQMLTGAPELILMTWLLLVALALVARRPKKAPFLWRFALVVIGVTGLTSAQLFPFFELLLDSQRDKDFARAFWAMPGWGWANLLVPLFHCGRTPQGMFVQAGQSFMPSYYLGATAIGLAGIALVLQKDRWVRVLVGATLFSLILALGEQGFIYDALRRVFPPLGFARYPIKFVLLSAFTIPLLAGSAIAALHHNSPHAGRFDKVIALTAWGVLTFCIAALLCFAWRYPFPADSWSATASNGLIRLVFFSLIWSALFLRPPVKVTPWFQVFVLVMIWTDFRFHTPKQNPTLPAWVFAPRLLQQTGKLPNPPQPGQSRAMITPRWELAMHTRMVPDFLQDFLGERVALWSNLNLLDHIPKVNGASTLLTAEQMDVESLLYRSLDQELPKLQDFLGVSFLTRSQETLAWSPRETYLPLVTSVAECVFVERTNSLEVLADPAWDPRRTVYLSMADKTSVTTGPHSIGTVSEFHFGANQLHFKVRSPGPTFVVIGQTYYRPWRAYVDGKNTQLLRANHAFQAIEITGGEHWVRLVYRDRIFFAGAAVSLISLILIGWAYLRLSRPVKGAGLNPG